MTSKLHTDVVSGQPNLKAAQQFYETSLRLTKLLDVQLPPASTLG